MIFYTRISTRAYVAPNTEGSFLTLPAGSAKQVVDEVNDWLVFKEGTKLYFVKKSEVEYKAPPDLPADFREQLAALLAWARGIGFKG